MRKVRFITLATLVACSVLAAAIRVFAAGNPAPVFAQAPFMAVAQSLTSAVQTVADCTVEQSTKGYDCTANGAQIVGLAVVNLATNQASTITCTITRSGTAYATSTFVVPISLATSTSVVTPAFSSISGLASSILGLPSDSRLNPITFLIAGIDKLTCAAASVGNGPVNYFATGAAF